MSVAVLSLCMIMASRATEAGIVPLTFSSTRLLRNRTESFTGNCSCRLTLPLSSCRRNSASTYALKLLPQNRGWLGFSPCCQAAVVWAPDAEALNAGERIRNAFSPLRALKEERMV